MILVWFVSVPLLKEAFHPLSFIGILLVFGGLAFTQQQTKGVRQSSGLRWAVLAGVFIAGYHLSYGQALKHGMTPTVLFSISLWIAVPILALNYGQKIRTAALAEFKTNTFKIIAGGIICSASFILFLKGLKGAGAGHAITLRNTSVIFAQIFAIAIGEKVGLKQLVGSILVGLGAALT